MSETIGRNEALMRQVYDEMWNRADPTAARRLFAKPEGVESFVRGFLTAFPDLRHEIEDCITAGDQVVTRFSAHGTHHGPWKGLAPTGRLIQYSGITLARIGGDRIVQHHTWWDALEVVEQIRRTI